MWQGHGRVGFDIVPPYLVMGRRVWGDFPDYMMISKKEEKRIGQGTSKVDV